MINASNEGVCFVEKATQSCLFYFQIAGKY